MVVVASVVVEEGEVDGVAMMVVMWRSWLGAEEVVGWMGVARMGYIASSFPWEAKLWNAR